MLQRRRHLRYHAKLPCIVEANGISFHSVVSDLSLGGLRVTLPPLSKAFLTGPVRAVQIEGLPNLGVKTRWATQNSVGLEFASPDRAQRHIGSLIDALDLTPQGEPDQQVLLRAV
ncbi:MAG: PilZ domain-containing protein [Maritimibacter sp.]|jgi:hypothetical protein